jgi:hypothetical protein
MANAHAQLALETLVVGRSFERTWVIDPPPGKSNADVVTELTGATATVSIVDADGTTEIVAADAIDVTITEASRLFKVEIAADDTADLTPGLYRWKAYVTKAGKQWAITLGEARVRALP